MFSESTWQRGREHLLGCRLMKCGAELGRGREWAWGKERENIDRVCVWPGLQLSTQVLPVSTGRNGSALDRDSGLFLRTACFLDGWWELGRQLSAFVQPVPHCHSPGPWAGWGISQEGWSWWGPNPPGPSVRKSKIGNKFSEPEPRLGQSELGMEQTMRFSDCAVGTSPDTCLSCSHCGGGHSCPVAGRAVRRQMDGFHSDRRELANLSQEVPGVHKDFQRGRRSVWIIEWMG